MIPIFPLGNSLGTPRGPDPLGASNGQNITLPAALSCLPINGPLRSIFAMRPAT